EEMIVAYYTLTSGEIVMISDLLGEAEVAANQPPSCGYVSGDEDTDYRTQYVDLNTLVLTDKPLVPVMASGTYDLSVLAAGASLVVTDEVGVSTEVPTQADTLELTDPGSWRVRSISPFPWIDFDVEVIVP
ncbi:MAG: hypothetical protein ACI8R4_003952, partial [Paracoccaceae bacterium]